MLQDIVKIGDKIEVRLLDNNREIAKSSKTHVSQMIDFEEDNVIIVAAPIHNGMRMVMHKGAYYRLYFYAEKGLFQCDCIVLQTFREKKMILQRVKIISEPEKVQRRRYFRIKCLHEILYRKISEEEYLLKEKLISPGYLHPDERTEIRKALAAMENKWSPGVIIDLSGGGCKFTSDEELSQGDKIRIKLDFVLKNDLKKLDIVADVIASQKKPERAGKYEHRVEFTGITQNERDLLIKYIFEQERKLRQKSLD